MDRKHIGVALVALLCGLWLAAGLAIAAEESQRVTAKDKAVVKNDQIDHNDEEETQPESVESLAEGKIRIISKTFLPPERWKFKVFKDAATHVDIWANPEGLGFDRLKDTDAEVKIRGVFPAPKNAGNFPLRGEGNLQPPAGPGGPGGAPKEWHWAAKVLDVKVDLDIHNGQGGDEVPEEKEETGGAFTVANLNDTDGDGKTDNEDNNVKATAKGRDEVDLMKLVLRKPEPDMGDKVTLKIVSGKVAIWRFPTKQAEVKNLEFPTATLPLELWVEATDVSGTVRDIVIEMDYKGVKDTVKATGVWANFLSFRNKAGEGLSKDADGAEIKRQFAANGGALGMQMVPATGIAPVSFYNNVEVGFTVRPAGIGDEPGIAFDISRQRETQGVNFRDGTRTVLPADPYPGSDELPNDDAGGNDEDVIPTNDHIFSLDGPGPDIRVPIPKAASRRLFRERHFREYVRVRFDGTLPSGNKVDGSRCSDKVPWFANDDVEKKSGEEAFKVTSSSSGEGNPPFSPLP